MPDEKFCRKCGKRRSEAAVAVLDLPSLPDKDESEADANDGMRDGMQQSRSTPATVPRSRSEGTADESKPRVSRAFLVKSETKHFQEYEAALINCISCGHAISPESRCCKKCGTDRPAEAEHEFHNDSKTDLAHPARLAEREKKAVFADAESMKERVRMAIHRKPYDVMNFYHTEGYPQMIARSPWFDNITLGVITFNALWISYDTDNNDAATLTDAEPIFIVAENFFCVYFLVEWAVRFLAFYQKRNCFRDHWFMFDSVLLILMVTETWIFAFAASVGDIPVSDTSVLKMFRVSRLTRMARMIKLLQAMPELLVLIKGIFVAARSVFYTLCLLTAIIYVFAVAFRQLTDGLPVGEQYFRNVPTSMTSLLVYGVLPDMAPVINDLGRQHIFLAVLILLFILLASLTVMNMLVGVLVEVVSVVSAVEKEELNVAYVKDRLKTLVEACSTLDVDGDMKISAAEFTGLLLMPAAASAIQDVGVDPVGLVDFAEFIFRDQDELTFGDFIEIILQFRGSNASTVKDVVELRRYMMTELRNLELIMNFHTGMLQEMTKTSALNPSITMGSRKSSEMFSSSLRDAGISRQMNNKYW